MTATIAAITTALGFKSRAAETVFLVALVFTSLQHFAFGQNPLPLVGSWNTGQFQRSVDEDCGFDPNWQREMIINGWPMIASFEFYEKYRTPDTRKNRDLHFGKLWKFAKDHQKPVSFVGENFADRFRLDMPWRAMRSDPEVTDHPFIEYEDGTRPGLASPIGDNVHHWYDLGVEIGGYLEREFAVDYPDCPRVLIYNNAEIGWARRGEELNDVRCPQWYKDLDPESRARVHRYNMRIRRAAMLKGFRDACPTWTDVLEFYAYGSFGEEFGNGELTNQSNKRIYEVPWRTGKFPFYSAAWVGYIPSWQTWEPDTIRSPPIQASTVKWVLDKYREVVDPSYQMDSMYWNGKRDDAAVWQGNVRQVMWTTRTNLHRLFTSAGQSREDTLERDYMPLLEAAKEVHDHPVLKRFWQHGELLPNRWIRDFDEIPKLHVKDTAVGYGHPYHWSRSMPVEWDPGDRWFQQRVPVNNRFRANVYGNRMYDAWQADRSRQQPVNVFAICLQLGDEYLVVACAPRGVQNACEIQVCPDGYGPRLTVTVDIPVEGAFWYISGDGEPAKLSIGPETSEVEL